MNMSTKTPLITLYVYCTCLGWRVGLCIARTLPTFTFWTFDKLNKMSSLSIGFGSMTRSLSLGLSRPIFNRHFKHKLCSVALSRFILHHSFTTASKCGHFNSFTPLFVIAPVLPVSFVSLPPSLSLSLSLAFSLVYSLSLPSMLYS